MNQILSTRLKNNFEDRKNKHPQFNLKEKKNWFRFQFVFSIFVMGILVLFGSIYFYHLERKEDFSNSLISNYNIYRLYQSSYATETSQNKTDNSNNLFGIIEIPKIELYYPVFSNLTEELLKTSPCKFYGDTPSANGNICIAGHNYDNRLFFSKISTLSPNDIIYIYDNNGFKYMYVIDNIYEVPSSDLSPVLNYEQNEKILTLVTCNNFNNNRIIVRAKQK